MVYRFDLNWTEHKLSSKHEVSLWVTCWKFSWKCRELNRCNLEAAEKLKKNDGQDFVMILDKTEIEVTEKGAVEQTMVTNVKPKSFSAKSLRMPGWKCYNSEESRNSVSDQMKLAKFTKAGKLHNNDENILTMRRWVIKYLCCMIFEEVIIMHFQSFTSIFSPKHVMKVTY